MGFGWRFYVSISLDEQAFIFLALMPGEFMNFVPVDVLLFSTVKAVLLHLQLGVRGHREARSTDQPYVSSLDGRRDY